MNIRWAVSISLLPLTNYLPAHPDFWRKNTPPTENIFPKPRSYHDRQDDQQSGTMFGSSVVEQCDAGDPQQREQTVGEMFLKEDER
jgi:hypothetical protein